MRWLVVVLVGCGPVADGVDDTDTDDPPTCGPPGEVTALATGLAPGTEGVAFGPDGTLYVTAKDYVVTIAADGTVATLADTVGGLVGAAWWRDALWVAAWLDEAGDDAPALLEISAAGGVTRHDLATIDKPNFMVPTAWGTLLVADDFDTRIFELDASLVESVWASDVPSPNGMAFSPDGSTLYVASTFTDPGLSAIAVDGEAAGAREVLAAMDGVPDGIAVTETGEVLVALNIAGRIDVWSPEGVETVASGVDTVASLAFGRGDFDPCAVVATSLFGDALNLVQVGREGL